MKKCRLQNAACKNIFAAIILTLFPIFLTQNFVAQSNKTNEIPNGGYVKEWLISNQFPTEIDAGTWESFNRFNIERLPVRDWLSPFGGAAKIKPVIGITKATQVSNSQKSESQNQNANANAPLPEVGVVTDTKKFTDAAEVNWRKILSNDPAFDFYKIFGSKTVGTAYAAANLIAAENSPAFIETDGFAGEIWLNGVKIYDGFSLNIQKIVRVELIKGENLMLVRSSGVSGDYWRRNGGWSASIRFWKDEASAEKSAQYKPSGAGGTINYLEGFHVDPVYLHDQRGYARITLSNTAQYLRNLRSDPRYGVYLSEIDYLKPYLDTNPQDREFLREAVRQGRVGAGGAYNQFNENTIGGEAIIRNILYGQSMHNALLGRKSESLALWDVFGHAPQISQIALKAGFTGLVWSKKIQGFEPFFYDYALDGSRLLHRRVDYAYSFSGFGSGKNYSLDNFRKMTGRKFEEAQSFNSATDLRINAADFTPPWTNLAGNVGTLEAQKPKIRVSGQAQDFYFRELNKEIADGKVKPPITSRDKLFFHVGVSMARSDLKIGQRISENMTLTAEKFGTIAYLLGAEYPDLALDKAWRQIFFGSHHDAITGTPSDNSFLDLVQGYREAFELSQSAANDSLSFITRQINTNSVRNNSKNQIPIVVFNSMNWVRTDVVRAKINLGRNAGNLRLLIVDNEGSGFYPKIIERSDNEMVIEFVAKNIPSLGYRVYQAEIVTDGEKVRLDGVMPPGIIENEYYRIEIDQEKGGAVRSIFDKQAKREIIDVSKNRYANEIGVLREELTKKNVIYPAWELWTTGEKSFSSEKKSTVSVEQDGSSQSLKISGLLPNKTGYLQTITLYKGVKRIDFKTEIIDYKGKNELFVVNFPLNLAGGALVMEDRFGTVVRNSSKGFLDFRTNTDKLVSGAPVYSVNNWAEYGSTYNLNFLDSGNIIAASVPFKPAALVRPHGVDFEKNTETIVGNLIKRGVSVTPFYDDFDAARRAKLTIEDSTMPKNLNDDAAYHNFRIVLGAERENSFSAKLLKKVSAHTKSSFDERLKRDGYAFLFLYDAETAKDFPPMPTLLIAASSSALYEKAVAKITAPISENKFETDLPLETFAVETKPEIELPKVPDYGVALINKGTAGVSLEKGNVLTLFLSHTADFPGVNLPFDFTPEHKTHIYEYSLYPHEKNWREADTVKAGHDANNPLIAVQTDVHQGELKAENSFLAASGTQNNVILSSLKLAGNKLANFKTNNSKEASRPVIMRFYESAGLKSSAAIIPKFIQVEPSITGEEIFEKVNLLEEPRINSERKTRKRGTVIPFIAQFEPNAIETFKLATSAVNAGNDKDRRTIGAIAENVQPVFSRYWQHNSGAAPIGNDAVKVSLRPLEQQGELSTFAYDDKYNQGGTTTVGVRVSVVNNYQDRKISGEVKLDVPNDWRVVPATLKYDIEPNGSFPQDVAVITFPVKKGAEWERSSGLIKARIEHDGQTFQDVLNLGKPLKVEWTGEQTPEETIIKIKNPHRQVIEGSVALITPPEAWSFNEPLFPREISFAAQPSAEIILRFKTGALPAGTWRIARLAYNGNVEYLNAGR